MRPSSALSRQQQQSRPGSAKPTAGFGNRPSSALARPGSALQRNKLINTSILDTGRGVSSCNPLGSNNTNVAVMNNSDRVKVAVRIRPIISRCDSTTTTTTDSYENNNTSATPNSTTSIATVASGSSVVLVKPHLDRERAYEFDHVIDGGQEQLYEAIGKPLLHDALLKGYNCCVFGYGQTGSGKSHSMLFPSSSTSSQTAAKNTSSVSQQQQFDDSDPFQLGLFPRLVHELFQQVQKKMEENNHNHNHNQKYSSVRVNLSMMEIYMEKVRDLLTPRPENPPRGYEPENLELQDDGGKRVRVKGLTTHQCVDEEAVRKLLSQALKNRQTAETKMNESSSRSHLMIQLSLVQQFTSSSSSSNPDLESTLTVVDLAGSERQTKSGTSGQTLEEGKMINLSLLTLGRALHSLSEGNKDVVSLRDSKLTRLLGEALTGNSKTWMLATVASASCHVQETLSTLDYATHARAIVNSGVQVNQFKVAMIEATKMRLVESIREKIQLNSKDELKMLQVREFKERLKFGAGCFEKLVEVAQEWMMRMFSHSSSKTRSRKSTSTPPARNENEDQNHHNGKSWNFILSRSANHFSSSTASKLSKKLPQKTQNFGSKLHRVEVEYGSDFAFCSSCKKAPAILCSIAVEEQKNTANNNMTSAAATTSDSVTGSTNTSQQVSRSSTPCSVVSDSVSGADEGGREAFPTTTNSHPMRVDLRVFSVENLPIIASSESDNDDKMMMNNFYYLELYSKVEEDDDEVSDEKNQDDECIHQKTEDDSTSRTRTRKDDGELCLGAFEFRLSSNTKCDRQQNHNNDVEGEKKSCASCSYETLSFHKSLYFSGGMSNREVIVVKIRKL